MSTTTSAINFLSEFRYPTRWYSKLIVAILAASLFISLATAAIASYLVYRIVTPAQGHSEINLENFPGHPEILTYQVAGSETRDGWFFPGLKSAPTVILCPAYQSSREELLTLASALQDHQYNVLLFDFSGHGVSGGRSTLGFQEVGELRTVMDAVAHRGDVDANRFGLWGMNLGGYVAIAEAISDKRVRALVAESAYDYPEQMIRSLVNRAGLGRAPFVPRVSEWGFYWLNYKYRQVLPLSKRLETLTGVPQLYLVSPDDPALAGTTSEIFRQSPLPHDLVSLQHGNFAAMMDEEKRDYENRIVSFFLVNLPTVLETPPQK
jgi:pimeloyl-ACP methyl ester carboxylesterase